MSATGYAIAAMNGRIYVKTVSETRRAAIINYLVVNHSAIITRFHSDDDIERMWKHYGQYANVVQVSIEEIRPIRAQSEDASRKREG